MANTKQTQWHKWHLWKSFMSKYLVREFFFTFLVLCIYIMASCFVFMWDSSVCKCVVCVHICCVICTFVGSFSFVIVHFVCVFFFFFYCYFLDASLFSETGRVWTQIGEEMGRKGKDTLKGNCNQTILYENFIFNKKGVCCRFNPYG